MNETTKLKENAILSFAEFLEQVPPGTETKIKNMCVERNNQMYLAEPDIRLYCSSTQCDGERKFKHFSHSGPSPMAKYQDAFVTYQCRNCESTWKKFAVKFWRTDEPSLDGTATKFGEHPAFGPRVPARVLRLVQRDKDIFLKGRRAESQGMGIGAFAYYRRVVENEKNHLITEIASVAKRAGVSNGVLSEFEKAKNENQFSKAVESIKDIIPTSLFIDNHNPLMLLHSALSEGLHAQSDEECLKLATSVRVVLTDLSERISLALKEEAELKQAITKLMQRKNTNTNM